MNPVHTSSKLARITAIMKLEKLSYTLADERGSATIMSKFEM